MNYMQAPLCVGVCACLCVLHFFILSLKAHDKKQNQLVEQCKFIQCVKQSIKFVGKVIIRYDS